MIPLAKALHRRILSRLVQKLRIKSTSFVLGRKKNKKKIEKSGFQQFHVCQVL